MHDDIVYFDCDAIAIQRTALWFQCEGKMKEGLKTEMDASRELLGSVQPLVQSSLSLDCSRQIGYNQWLQASTKERSLTGTVSQLLVPI